MWIAEIRNGWRLWFEMSDVKVRGAREGEKDEPSVEREHLLLEPRTPQ